MSQETRRAIEIVLALFLLAGIARDNTRRLERAAERQILQQLGGRGQVRVHIEPRWGALGVWLARAEHIRVYAADFATDRIPFSTETPVHSWSGRADRVSILLENFRLGAVPVTRLEATIPDVWLDSREAAFRLRIRLFKAGWGEGTVVLEEHDLAEFVRRRLPEIHDARVRITPTEVCLSGSLMMFSAWPFEACGVVGIRNGCEVVVEQVRVQVEGEPLAPSLVAKVTDALNPIVDIARDLRLGSAFIVERTEQGNGYLKLIGRATIPPRQ